MKNFVAAAKAVVGIVAVSFALTAGAEKAPSFKVPELKYEKFTLPNGLKVIDA
jgi:hypothetical protein